MAMGFLTPSRSGGLIDRGLDPFQSFRREMSRLFEDAFRSDGEGRGGGGFLMPHMDACETEQGIRITAELPGVEEKDIEVALDDDVLTIRGEKRSERKDEHESMHFSERSFGTFQRSVRLPFRVDPGQVKANFEGGVLTVTVPKDRTHESTRKIPVQAGAKAGNGAGKQAPQVGSQQTGMKDDGQQAGPGR